MTLDPDYRRTLARAARMQRQWRHKRDQAIRQAHRSGASLREIAETVDLSPAGVDRIIKRGNQ